MKHHPMQPLERDEHGALRFKSNKIVCDLLELATQAGFDLNKIERHGYSDEDLRQFAQLLGYSLSGYGEKGYVSDEAYAVADAARLPRPPWVG